jgi:hypothetical protein
MSRLQSMLDQFWLGRHVHTGDLLLFDPAAPRPSANSILLYNISTRDQVQVWEEIFGRRRGSTTTGPLAMRRARAWSRSTARTGTGSERVSTRTATGARFVYWFCLLPKRPTRPCRYLLHDVGERAQVVRPPCVGGIRNRHICVPQATPVHLHEVTSATTRDVV